MGSHMFMELFKYISGVNQNQEEMEMTSPVETTHEIVKEDPEGNYEDEQMTAPAPLDNNKVYLKTRPAMYVFVRRFGGFPLTHAQWEKQRLALEADLLVGRLKYKIEDYMTVGYDSPWKMVKRRNEVWMQCLEGTHPLPAPVARNHHQ